MHYLLKISVNTFCRMLICGVHLSKQFKTRTMKTKPTNIEFKIETKELYRSKVYERNIEKHGMRSDQCECCGRLLNELDSLMVHMGIDWLAYNTDKVELIDGIHYISGTKMETQGFFRIGNDCAKKMKGFTF